MPVIAPPSSEPKQMRFSVSDYHRMAEAGALGIDRRIQLLDGHIYEMSPIGSKHAACVDRLTRFFVRAAEDDAIVRIQNPIVLPPNSEPEPDVALLQPHPDGYAARHPRADEVLLVVEVADSSLTFDQEVKVPIYAQAGIPLVWVVALDEDCVHVYQTPGRGTYRAHNIYEPGSEIPLPTVLSDTSELAVSDMLGR